MENRISVKHKNPNPLFEKWLIEWREQAKEKNLKTQHAYTLALSSLRKYPLPLEKGKDCKILKGFGNKLCEMLDEALETYRKQPDHDIENIHIPPITKKKRSATKVSSDEIGESSDGDGYVPAYRTGAYAILIALYNKTLEENYQGFMLKKDLIKEAQHHCDTSFTKAEVGSFYTSWNSMKTLLSKKLVKKESNPPKFSLTSKGVVLSRRLLADNDSMKKQFNSSSSLDEPNGNKVNIDKCVVLSDSDDDNTNLDDVISGKTSTISNELKGICGVFTNENNLYSNKEEICKSSVNPQKVISRENSSKMSGNNVDNISDFEDFIMEPFSFEVILYVDTQETNGKQIDPKNDAILSELQRLNVTYEVKNLKVGDYCWICRHKASGKELVTPYIIERKRMDDLAGSIKDGRFHEQKFRIKQCGLKNIIYMVESYGTKDQHVGLPLNSLNQAIVNTLIQDGFIIKIVEGIRGVAEYLSCLSNLIKKNFEEKTIASCPKDNMSDVVINDDFISLMYFKEFNKSSSKTKNFMVKEMFIRQLLQIKGLSVEKAMAIVEEYPTPRSLKDMIVENDKKSVNIISNIKYGKLGKKIGPLLSDILYMFYTKMSF